MRSECDRTRLIAELATLLRDCELPDEARHAGLTLIGWLARRMPGEGPSIVGVEQASRQRGQASGCAGAAGRLGATGAHASAASEAGHATPGELTPLGDAAPMAPLGDTSPLAAHGASACCGSVVARVSATVIGMRKPR